MQSWLCQCLPPAAAASTFLSSSLPSMGAPAHTRPKAASWGLGNSSPTLGAAWPLPPSPGHCAGALIWKTALLAHSTGIVAVRL